MKLYIHAAEDVDNLDYYDKMMLAEDSEDPKILAELVESVGENDFHVRSTVARNPNTPVEVLVKLADDENIREDVVTNPNTPVEVLVKLADDENYNVRSGIAKNPNTPSRIIERLIEDAENAISDYNRDLIWDAVRRNPNTPVEFLEKLTEEDKEDSYDIMKKESKSTNDKVWLEYDVSADDPADWYIDYDEFFEIIDSVLDDLDIDIENYDEEETRGGRICTYELSSGETIDSYDLETELLNDLYDGKVDDTEIYQYIKKYLKKYK